MRRAFVLMVTVAVLISSLQVSNSATKSDFIAEVWADNWFELYVNGKRVGSDSIPITTARSFNSERIEFSSYYPLNVGIIAKDYVENSSGLEYVGTERQQIGDGGIIFQFRDLKTNNVLAVSNRTWRVMTINKAPLNPECASSLNPIVECLASNQVAPKKWFTSQFDFSKWARANLYSEAEVGVKEGYFEIAWSPKAKLIWSNSLKLDNALLIRKTIYQPK